MNRSKALKLFNKFNGWARHEAMIRAEEAQGRQEFLHASGAMDEQSDVQVMALFWDWFIFDRPLTSLNITPLRFFIKTRACKLKRSEAAVYEAFAAKNRFGLLKIEEVLPGRGLKLKGYPGGETFEVVDLTASRESRPGYYLVARIIPYEDHWVFPGFVCGLPDADGSLARNLDSVSKKAAKESYSPKDALRLFIKKTDWQAEGPERVKARLASTFERWGLAELTVSRVEEAVARAHEKKEGPPAIFEEVLKKVPVPSEIEEVQKLLAALWNLSIGEHRPDIPKGALDKGPVEKSLMAGFAGEMVREFSEKEITDPKVLDDLGRERLRGWLEKPKKSLDGKTPKEAILAERASRGNPETRIEYSFSVTAFKTEDSLWKEGVTLSRKAQSLLFKGKAEEAAGLYERAVGLLKGYPDLHKVCGNLAGARIQLGNREGALEALHAALKCDPDYKIARDNLHLLDSMTPEEFKERFDEGFFKQTNIVR